MKKPSVEIRCEACGRDSLLLREPVYEGFKRVGESLRCAACGHRYDSEEAVPFKEARAVRVFSEADRPAEVKVFDPGEARLCRHCAHYIVNPFTQWCALHKREVQATDTCPRFAPAPTKDGLPPSGQPLPPL